MKKLKAFHPIYFRGKSHFEDDGTQNWLVFQLIERYFKKIAGASNGRYVYYVYYWQSEGLSDETINSIKTSNHSISPNLDYYDTKRRVEFNGSCLKQDKIAFNYGKVVSIYIVYEINKSINISDYPTLENCLFGAVGLTKNVDIDKYKYLGYGIGFDRKGSYSIGNEFGGNVILFWSRYEFILAHW